MENKLSNIKNGEVAIIRKLKNSNFKVKMMEMGLIEGRILRVLFRAPFGGPMAIDVNGYTLSLRKDEAELVFVDTINSID